MDKQRRPLTPKEIKLVKATAEGKNQTEAGLIADSNRTPGSARVWANQTLQKPTVQQALAAAFEKHGITVDAMVKPIADGLQAEKVHTVGNGDQAMTEVVPDHAIRLKASGMAANFMGIGKQAGDVTINFINQSSEQREIYDL